MGPFVVAVAVLPDYCLQITFTNGERRVFDAKPYLDTGVFRKLRDGRFSSVRVVNGAIEWPGEIDLSWDTVYLRGVPVGGEAAPTALETGDGLRG
ncbi:MAG: DUF2442 domain-containing protein [Candidatus Sericytochromatia bacterium]|nr:DUF2442 domain-containing protein [Candidatus Tanganyikabacteria bacterium]